MHRLDAMPHGLDHIVHAVRDLDAAAELYARLGFTVGTRNRHPWGTHNRIVQFPGVFIELLTVAEPEKIPDPTPGVFSFGAFNRDFLATGEGLSMLALESRDAAADAHAFQQHGIGGFDVFRFAREGQGADGALVNVAFSLAFARDARAPNAGFFVCQQHSPEHFWNPALQRHANGAYGIAGVVLVAENPTDHHIFLSAFTGVRDLEATSTGITVRTARGDLQAMDPAAFRIHYGVEPPAIAGGARIAALRLCVDEIDTLRGLLAAAGIGASERMGRLAVAAHGATLVFEPRAGLARA